MYEIAIISTRYDNVDVYGQRLRVVPASINWEQENERNVPQPVSISPSLYSSYTPRIFPRQVQVCVRQKINFVTQLTLLS